MTSETPSQTFADLGVSDAIVSSLAERDIVNAFPIQVASIEAALAGRDICGKAPTGSGKTLAFGIPAVELSNRGTPWRPSVLILSPTRELATQIKDELEPLAKACDRSILTVFGGTNIERDIRRLEKGIDILVACPGRLEDLIGRRCCELRNVEIVVVDEADRMADMGFLPSVKRILDQTPGNRHTLLFSATLDGDVDMLIKRYQNDPLTYEVEEQIGDVGDVEHSWYVVQPVDRVSSAIEVLRRYDSSIVFCRTRRGCDRVAKNFAKKGLTAVAIHGDRSQAQRERALRDFTDGRAQVLVATDVAARGIHVDNVELVMHYDPAGSDKDYIHRSGRTGRAGQDGRVVSMVVEDKRKIARQLMKELGVKPGFEELDLDSFPAVVVRAKPKAAPKPQQDDRFSGDERDDRPPRGRSDRNRSDRGERGRANRGGNNRSQQKPNQRNNRGHRSDQDRNDQDRDDRGGRKSNDRNDRGGRKSNDRDDRGGRKSNDRDDRGGGRSDRFDRGERRPDGKRTKPRRRPGSNDWFPPGYHDEKPARGGSKSKKPGAGSDRDGRSSDDERKDRPSGGRNSPKRKSRDAKGRHADKPSNKNKGKRRGPKSR